MKHQNETNGEKPKAGKIVPSHLQNLQRPRARESGGAAKALKRISAQAHAPRVRVRGWVLKGGAKIGML